MDLNFINEINNLINKPTTEKEDEIQIEEIINDEGFRDFRNRKKPKYKTKSLDKILKIEKIVIIKYILIIKYIYLYKFNNDRY